VEVLKVLWPQEKGIKTSCQDVALVCDGLARSDCEVFLDSVLFDLNSAHREKNKAGNEASHYRKPKTDINSPVALLPLSAIVG